MTGLEPVPVIGLVGGVGSGKSTVARRLAERRPLLVLDGDATGHQVLTRPNIKHAIRNRFGESVFDPQGEIIRSALAHQVFGPTEQHRQNRADLEQIVHPEIRRTFEEQIQHAQASKRVEAVLLDAAVLLEAGWRDICNAVIFVDTPESARLQRVVTNRGWDDRELEKREASQLSLDLKRNAADYIVRNSGPVDEAVTEFEHILDAVIRRARPR